MELTNNSFSKGFTIWMKKENHIEIILKDIWIAIGFTINDSGQYCITIFIFTVKTLRDLLSISQYMQQNQKALCVIHTSHY